MDTRWDETGVEQICIWEAWKDNRLCIHFDDGATTSGASRTC